VFQLFNACPHTELKGTFRHGHVTDDVITPNLQKVCISWQAFFHVMKQRPGLQN